MRTLAFWFSMAFGCIGPGGLNFEIVIVYYSFVIVAIGREDRFAISRGSI
jgi:hypothetical protein